MAEQVLARLRDAGGWCSGEAIGAALGITRSAVSKHVATLRRAGYTVESASRRGLRLADTPDVPSAAEVQPRLRTQRFGRVLRYRETVDSTNNRAVEDAKAGAPEGVVWVGGHQSAGRGRLQRTWHSPAGENLYASIILRPGVPLSRIGELALVTAVAIRQALAACHPALPVRIKWPNDLVVGSRKLCGVLCESEVEADAIHHAVVGFGLNIHTARFPRELDTIATSVRREQAVPASRAVLLAAVLNRFEPVYDTWRAAADLAPFLADLEAHSQLQGRDVAVALGGRRLQGRVRGVAATGELLLDCGGGTVRVTSGDVHILGISGDEPAARSTKERP